MTAVLPRRRSRAAGWVLSSYLIVSVSAITVLLAPRLVHWSIVPITVCGALVAVDAAEWARGRFDTFHPRGVFALFGLHFFYLAPILHIGLDYWQTGFIPPVDLRDAIGRMAVVNAAGLTLYRVIVSRRPSRQTLSHPRLLARGPFLMFSKIAIAISIATLVFVVVRLGGPTAYLSIGAARRERLEGLGWLLLVGEAFPLLGLAYLLVKRPKVSPYVLLGGFVVAQFVVGGLRGSRANMIWPCFMAAGMVHIYRKRIPPRRLVIGVAVGLLFMYAYGFYKSAGTETIGVIRGEQTIEELRARTDRSGLGLLLGDLARVDVQATVADRVATGAVAPAGGASYLGDVSIVVPQAILSRPRSKVQIGAEAMFGVGSAQVSRQTSRIYGLAGEGILNFGLVGGSVVFVALAVFMRFATRWYEAALAVPASAARLLVPALPVMVLLMLGSDLDNVVFFTVKQVLPLGAVILLAQRARRSAGPTSRRRLIPVASPVHVRRER